MFTKSKKDELEKIADANRQNKTPLLYVLERIESAIKKEADDESSDQPDLICIIL